MSVESPLTAKIQMAAVHP
uniref:Uncharacterized protein n=1 Tax=Anguilla anguilla TaxID=7936 RepID=A0A0E9UWX4_ANGAN